MKFFWSMAMGLLMVGCMNTKSNTAASDEATGMKQIQLGSKGCYGTCPQFSLTVMSDGTARYNAGQFNKRQGQFSTTLQKPQLDSLLQLVRKADYLNRKDTFPARVSDVVEYTSTLTLNDGKSKTIVDQGPSGPAELKNIYTFLLLLKNNGDWK